jgi:biotin-dependent carboxylase-like uncharacterized protein
VLEVVQPGVLLALQDLGRPGYERLGVPPSGACDRWGHAVAAVLAGAPPDAATAEVTLAGAELLVVETCVVALGGADLGAERDDGRALRTGAAHRLPSGARIRFAGAPSGMRAYLGLAGGIAAERSFESVSALAGLGAHGGRTLRAGDRLEPVRRGDLSAAGRSWPARLAPHPATGRGPLSFVAGPDLRHLPPDIVERLEGATWHVAAASDRMGIRLDGPSIGAGSEIISHPLLPGSIQLPADGPPLLILPDGPTVGGYPVVGVVPRIDHPRLGQLRPGDEVRFTRTSAEVARAAWRAAQASFAAAAEALRADEIWQRLAEHAAG